MRAFAYCAASFERSVRRAAGVAPLLSPPIMMETFSPAALVGHDFLYFKLHGLPGQPYWYGDGLITAISAEQIQSADLNGAVAFVANCHLDEENPMLAALLGAGAQAVIGGAGENYARSERVDGADLLGLYLRWMLELGVGAMRAFWVAKARLRLKRTSKATEDTLAFRLYKEVDRWVT